MSSATPKTLAALAAIGGAFLVLSSPAQAMPRLDPGLAAAGAPMVEKVWCGPYGCGPRWGGYGGYGGYGWRPHPRPWGYGYGHGYGWRPRPCYYGHRGYGWGHGYGWRGGW